MICPWRKNELFVLCTLLLLFRNFEFHFSTEFLCVIDSSPFAANCSQDLIIAIKMVAGIQRDVFVTKLRKLGFWNLRLLRPCFEVLIKELA